MSRARTAAKPSTLRRCTTEFTITAPGYSYAAGVGRVVDLSEPVTVPGKPGATIETETDPSWFAPLETEETRDHGDRDLDEG